MRRIALWVAGLAVLPLAMLFGPSALPAHAGSANGCWWDDGGFFYGDHSLCMTVYYSSYGTGDGDPGSVVTGINIGCGAGAWESSPSVDGKWLKVFNRAGKTTAVWDDAHSNISNCFRRFEANVAMGDSRCGEVILLFGPKFDQQPDPSPDQLLEVDYCA